MNDEMRAVLDSASAAIDKVKNWSPQSDLYTGSADGWFFTVCDFDIEDQGFPKGSRGYDGAGRSDGTVLHLTRELAQRAFEKAVEQSRGR